MSSGLSFALGCAIVFRQCRSTTDAEIPTSASLFPDGRSPRVRSFSSTDRCCRGRDPTACGVAAGAR
uniref:Putative secreted protein n=1 Tax=Anopheles triannulatus TaxID=58253 RepID=A0A2M4B6Z7_9DIPT